MKIELDGIPLNETQNTPDGIAEARGVSNIRVVDDRNLVRFEVPGMQGSVFQDMGRTAVKISFDGLILGASAKNVVEMMRSKFKGGEPVPFNSDLSGAADVSQVVIESFDAHDVAGTKDRYDYSIQLKEYKEAPVQPSAPAALPTAARSGAAGGAEGEEEEAGAAGAEGEEEGNAEGEAGAEAGAGEGAEGEASAGEGAAAEAGAESGGKEGEEAAQADKDAEDFVADEAKKSDEGVNTVTGEVVDAERKPLKGVTVTMRTKDDVRTAVTDDQGSYKFENIPRGKWKVTVDDDLTFEGVFVEQTIGEVGEEVEERDVGERNEAGEAGEMGEEVDVTGEFEETDEEEWTIDELETTGEGEIDEE